jgi:hypothetical protein
VGDPPAWGLGEVLTILNRKNLPCYEPFTMTGMPIMHILLRSKEVKYSKQIQHLNAFHPYESVKPICEVAPDDYSTFRVETCVFLVVM